MKLMYKGLQLGSGSSEDFQEIINDALKGYLALTGGTMSGDIDMSGNTVTGLKEPVNESDAATRSFVRELMSNTVTSVNESSKIYTDNAIQEAIIGALKGGLLIMAEYNNLNSFLTDIANSIRSKIGSDEKINAGDFVSKIEGITTGGDGINTNDATATSFDILNGKSAYVKGSKVIGTIPSIEAKTWTPTVSDQVINNGNYLSGNQIVKGDPNLIAGNIAKDKSIFGIQGNLPIPPTRLSNQAGVGTFDANTGKAILMGPFNQVVNNTEMSCLLLMATPNTQTYSPMVFLSIAFRRGNTWYSFLRNGAGTDTMASNINLVSDKVEFISNDSDVNGVSWEAGTNLSSLSSYKGAVIFTFGNNV